MAPSPGVGLSCAEILSESLRAQVRAGGMSRQLIPAQGLAWIENSSLHELAQPGSAGIIDRVGIGAAKDFSGDCMVQLRGEHLTHHVVMIIDRRGDNVDLAA